MLQKEFSTQYETLFIRSLIPTEEQRDGGAVNIKTKEQSINWEGRKERKFQIQIY